LSFACPINMDVISPRNVYSLCIHEGHV
jgi:hypothetical protein